MPCFLRARSAAIVASLGLTLLLDSAPRVQAEAGQGKEKAAEPTASQDAAATAAQGGASPEDAARRAQVIAKVDGVEITVGKVEDFLATQTPMLRERYANPEERKKLVENMMRVELLAAEAARRGYDKNPAVVRTVKDSSVQALLRQELDGKLSPQSVPAEEVKAYYEAHESEFHRPAMRRASKIVLATEEEAKKLLSEAQSADVRGFSELAKQHSIDAETKLRGGDMGYFPRTPAAGSPGDNVPEALREAVFKLKNPGDTSPAPVPVEGGFALLRLTGERPERHTELSDAEPSIRSKLWREKRQKALSDLVESLRAREKPQVSPQLVELVKFDDMDKRPGGFSPDRPQAGDKGPSQADTRSHP